MSWIENSFPINPNGVNKTTGKIYGVVLCVLDGDLTIAWKSGGSDTVSVAAGQAINLVNAIDATVVSGTFHYAI